MGLLLAIIVCLVGFIDFACGWFAGRRYQREVDMEEQEEEADYVDY